jgi:hypothetical protein
MENTPIQYPQDKESGIAKAQFLINKIIAILQSESKSKKRWSSDPNICNMKTIRNNINEKIKQTIINYKINEDPSVRLSPGWNVMYYNDTSSAIPNEKILTEIITSLKESQNFRDNVENCDGETTMITTMVPSNQNAGRKMRKSRYRHRKSNKKHRKGNKKHKKSIKKHKR